jgi:hypothetical protein
VELEGGTLEHGSTNGSFTLRAQLPWPPGHAPAKTGTVGAGP